MPDCSRSRKMMLFAVSLLVGLQIDLFQHCTAVVLSGCTSQGWIEIDETASSFPITCKDISDTTDVSWDVRTPQIAPAFIGIGICRTDRTCTDSRLSRPDGTTSTLTLTPSRQQGSYDVRCSQTPDQVVCQLNIVLPAVLSAGSVEVVKTSPSWTLRANTTITTVYSSQGRYSCTWYNESQVSGASVGSDTSPTLSPDASNKSDMSNRTGWCSSSWTMPLTPGTYSYVVVASPGETRKSAGSINIGRPANPSLGSGCPVDYVPEFSAVTCTCSTDNLGSPPGGIGWSNHTSSPVLSLPNVTRSDHNTNFTCNLKWSSITLHHTLNLRVSYRTKIKAFNLNNMATHLTVNESDITSVSLMCRSDGRPTPRMQLVRKHDGKVLKTVTGGFYADVDDDTVVDHVISPARCEDTGSYVCVSDNQLGPEERQTLNLFVNCVPRRADFPTVDYEGRPVRLSVNMVAFPLPDTFTFVFHGPGNNVSESETSGRLDMHCQNMVAAYVATCNITVNAITSKGAGFYSVRMGNSIGYSTVIFEVKYFEKELQTVESSSGGLSTGAAVGVTLALVFVVVGVVVGAVVVWMWRRHWVLPCASSSANESNNTEYKQSAVSPPVSVEREEQQNARSKEMLDNDQQATNQYEILRLQDIGVRSDYAELSHYVNAGMKSASRKGKTQ